MDRGEFTNATANPLGLPVDAVTFAPSLGPTIYIIPNTTVTDIAVVEQEHETDAITVLLMNCTLIVCLLLAYYVKQHRIYYLPERCVLHVLVYRPMGG